MQQPNNGHICIEASSCEASHTQSLFCMEEEKTMFMISTLLTAYIGLLFFGFIVRIIVGFIGLSFRALSWFIPGYLLYRLFHRNERRYY